MKWTYMLKWGLGFLVVLVLIFLHLQFDFIPKEILPVVGMILIVLILKIFQAYEKWEADMETLTKQELRKKLQKKVIVGRILTFIILVGLAWSHFHSLNDRQEGVMVGILLGLSLMTIRYNLVLRREENFEKLYIQVTDERNRMIDEKTRTLLFNILLLLAACLSVLSMVFPIILNLNQFLTLTIILVLGLYYLLRFLLSRRY